MSNPCDCERPSGEVIDGYCNKCRPCECGECEVVGGTCEAQAAKYDEEETPEAWVARMRSEAGQAAYVARMKELVDASQAAGIPFTDAEGRDIKCAACNCRWPDKQLGNGSYVHTDCIEDGKCSGCAGPWLITINATTEPVWPFTYRAATPPPPPFDGYCDECRPE